MQQTHKTSQASRSKLASRLCQALSTMVSLKDSSISFELEAPISVLPRLGPAREFEQIQSCTAMINKKHLPGRGPKGSYSWWPRQPEQATGSHELVKWAHSHKPAQAPEGSGKGGGYVCVCGGGGGGGGFGTIILGAAAGGALGGGFKAQRGLKKGVWPPTHLGGPSQFQGIFSR